MFGSSADEYPPSVLGPNVSGSGSADASRYGWKVRFSAIAWLRCASSVAADSAASSPSMRASRCDGVSSDGILAVVRAPKRSWDRWRDRHFT
jgi:hypothetical protein